MHKLNHSLIGTDVQASTIHSLFELDYDLKSKLDLAKTEHPKVAALLALEVLFIDEVSMIDVDCWSAVSELFAAVAHAKRPDARAADVFGELHLILFGRPLAVVAIDIFVDSASCVHVYPYRRQETSSSCRQQHRSNLSSATRGSPARLTSACFGRTDACALTKPGQVNRRSSIQPWARSRKGRPRSV